MQRVAQMYHIGSTKSGWVIYWQIDRSGQCRTGKAMKYQPNGHRDKSKLPDGRNAYTMDWVHSIMMRRGLLPDTFEPTQCLFGEHLIDAEGNTSKTIAIVEAEKTALICAMLYPDLVWLATGGKSQLNDRLNVLAGRNVLFFPDIDGHDYWTDKVMSLTNCKAKVSDVVLRLATDEDKANQVDIADILLREVQKHPQRITSAQHQDTSAFVQDDSTKPQHKASGTLQRMIEKNSTLQLLIDTFDCISVVSYDQYEQSG